MAQIDVHAFPQPGRFDDLNRETPPGTTKLRTRRIHSRIISQQIAASRGANLLRGSSCAMGFPRKPEPLPEQAIGSCSNTLAGGARG
jgi:hypothetical protein